MAETPTTGYRSNESGAVTVTVALLLVVFIGASAVAIDLGSAWTAKRALVADLDAASLAGAQLVAEVGPACSSQVESVKDRTVEVGALNGTLIDRDDIDVDCGNKVVEVRGRQEAVSVFASALGVTDLAASARSGATVDRDLDGGVMPLAICVNDQMITDFVAAGQDVDNETYRARAATGDAGYPVASYGSDGAATTTVNYADRPSPLEGVVHEVGQDKVWRDGACEDGDGAGNWGWLSFETTGNESILRELIREGYQGPIQLADPTTDPETVAVCGLENEGGACDGDTGKGGSGNNSPVPVLGQEYACVRALEENERCQTVVFIVYEQRVGGSGGNTEFQLEGLLSGRVWDTKAKGSARELQIEPLEYVTSGEPIDIDTAVIQRLRGCRADELSRCLD